MKVILAIDGSPHSHAALVEFSTMPWPPGTEVQVLTVIHSSIPMLFDPVFFATAARVQQTRERRQDAPALLEAAAASIREAHPGIAVTTSIIDGIPKEVITEEARRWGADLIVLGSRGHGRVRRVVLGSVAASVVAEAPCSVHVVRARHLLDEGELDVPEA